VGSIDTAYASGVTMDDGAWHHWAFAVNSETGKTVGYIDGDYHAVDSAISLTDFDTSDDYRFGSYTNEFFSCNCSMDDVQIYKGILTEINIDTIFSTPGNRVAGCGSKGDPPAPDPTDFTSYADSLFGQTFEGVSLTNEYNETNMKTDFAISGVSFPADPWTVGLGDYDGGNQTYIDSLIGKYNVNIVDMDALSGGTGDATRCMRIVHEANRWGILGANYGNGSGASFDVLIPSGYESLYFSYNIMRNENAEAFQEAKVPCLQGGWTWVAQEDRTGFRIQTKMNRKPLFEHEWHYSYPFDSEGGPRFKDPDDIGSNWEYDWTDSTWYNLTFRVDVNSQGSADGLVEVFIDGKLSSSVTGLELSTQAFEIDEVVINWFSGGTDSTLFAPATDQFLHIDDVYLWQYKTGYGPALRVQSLPGRILNNHPGWNYSTGKKK